MLLEVIPGLWGLLGIGWLYAGNTNAGIPLLLVCLFLYLITMATGGGFACVHFPLAWLGACISAFRLADYARRRPDLFRS